MFAANIEGYLKDGLVNIVGSCCGSGPVHTLEIAKKAALYKPRSVPAFSPRTVFSGLDTVNAVNNTVPVKNEKDDDVKKKFLRLLGEGNYEDAVEEARNMVDDGAAFINVEVKDERTVNGFLDFALMNPYAAKVPFYINSTDIKVIETGLKRFQGRCLAGPLTLKDGEAEFLKKAELIRLYGAAAVVTAGKDEAQKIYDLLKKNGYPADNIVIDSAPGVNIDNCPGFILAV
jgi:5-methyltetrahydrofolate--homocysteine methyltransferase